MRLSLTFSANSGCRKTSLLRVSLRGFATTARRRPPGQGSQYGGDYCLYNRTPAFLFDFDNTFGETAGQLSGRVAGDVFSENDLWHESVTRRCCRRTINTNNIPGTPIDDLPTGDHLACVLPIPFSQCISTSISLSGRNLAIKMSSWTGLMGTSLKVSACDNCGFQTRSPE